MIHTAFAVDIRSYNVLIMTKIVLQSQKRQHNIPKMFHFDKHGTVQNKPVYRLAVDICV